MCKLVLTMHIANCEFLGLPGQAQLVQPQAVSFSGSATPRQSSARHCLREEQSVVCSLWSSCMQVDKQQAVYARSRGQQHTPPPEVQPCPDPIALAASGPCACHLAFQGAAVHHDLHLPAAQRGAACAQLKSSLSQKAGPAASTCPMATQRHPAGMRCRRLMQDLALCQQGTHPARGRSALPAGGCHPECIWRR